MPRDVDEVSVELWPEEIEMLENTSFRRVTEYYNHRSLKVFDNIHPNDIKQGQLGDCYFLSAVSALAEFPHRVRDLFITKEFSA